MGPAEALCTVEVVFSPRARHVECVTLRLPIGSRVGDALDASGLATRHGVRTEDLALSVWGRRAAPGQALRDGDRVELCRALTVDPKEARRLRYQAQRKEKRPAGAGR